MRRGEGEGKGEKKKLTRVMRLISRMARAFRLASERVEVSESGMRAERNTNTKHNQTGRSEAQLGPFRESSEVGRINCSIRVGEREQSGPGLDRPVLQNKLGAGLGEGRAATLLFCSLDGDGGAQCPQLAGESATEPTLDSGQMCGDV